jgi:hypothetical protein
VRQQCRSILEQAEAVTAGYRRRRPQEAASVAQRHRRPRGEGVAVPCLRSDALRLLSLANDAVRRAGAGTWRGEEEEKWSSARSSGTALAAVDP